MPEKVALTEERVRKIRAPESGDVFVWDAEAPGLAIRCYASGRKVYVFQYRAGHGRKAAQRRMNLGAAGTRAGVSLSDVRGLVRRYHGVLVDGRDPQAERQSEERLEEARLDRALDAYEAALERRGVVNRKTIMSTLRSGLLKHLGKVDLGSVERRDVAAIVARIESGMDGVAPARANTAAVPAGEAAERPGSKVKPKPGAAQDLRAKATTFLNWATNQGLIHANPLAGWRRERMTRAQVQSRSGRALSDNEIRVIWNACNDVTEPFGDFVRALVLLGQRRKETSLMRWQDVDVEQGVWTIPGEIAKNGREHRVPLPGEALAIIGRQPKWNTSPYVFAGRDPGDKRRKDAADAAPAMSGWSSRLSKLTSAAGVNFTLHDCRRTFRSGLSRLGIDADVAELMLNHTRADLVERYDREPRWVDRQAAAQRWADHVAGVVGQARHEAIVPLRKKSMTAGKTGEGVAHGTIISDDVAVR